jgi:hypothetical protein
MTPTRTAYFINANSATKPGIVDSSCQQILERSEVYSGVYGRASINFYAFNSNGNKGIACGLNNLQKIRDGEPLGGKPRAEDDFATADDDAGLRRYHNGKYFEIDSGLSVLSGCPVCWRLLSWP